MSRQQNILRLVTDGTVSLTDVRRTLATHGELVGGDAGPVRFVPDDPSFPTTVFQGDGLIELDLTSAADLRLEKYLAELSSWLTVGLQRIAPR